MNTLTMPAHTSIEQRIRAFLASHLLFSGEDFPYSDDASLLEEGIIDSLAIMELVEFVQQTFDVSVDQHEVVPENFDSVAKLSALVRSKLGAPEPTQESKAVRLRI